MNINRVASLQLQLQIQLPSNICTNVNDDVVEAHATEYIEPERY